jgi:hypothetical protein
MVRAYKDSELIEKIKSLPSFKGWPKGPLDVWVRSKSDDYDKFDDKCYSFDCSSGTPRFVMVCSGTTNAGSAGLKNFKVYNPKGCAVLKTGVIVYDSHVQGLHKGKPAYVQNKPFPYYRDNNGNEKAEEIGVEYNNIIGANCHPAGSFSTIINNWSLACLVRNVKTQFDTWFKYMNKRPLTTVILKEF